MRKTNRKYEVRPLGCDWALDIPLGDTTVVLYFNSRNNAELVKDVLEWEDNHPNEAAPYQPALTPPNEPLTLDELREMDGEPVYVVPIGKCKWATRQWCVLAADEVLIPGVDHWWWSFEDYGETWIAYRRPPEGEEDT